MHRNTLTRHRRARFAREGNDGGGGGQQTGQTGGNDSGQQAGSQSGQTGGGAGQTGGQQQGGDQTGQQQASQQTGQPQGQPDGLPDDPAALRAMIADLRRENASSRTNAKATAAQEARDALAQEIGKALGLVKGDEAPDPAKLTEQLTGVNTENHSLKVENAVLRSAGKHGADPEALTDSRSFLAKLNTLDPTAADFAATVDAAIKAAVDSNPKLKAGRVPGASGADHTGGPGEGAVSPEQFAAMTVGQRNELYATNPVLYRQLAGR